jgi:predicted nucleic acid-binding protein
MAGDLVDTAILVDALRGEGRAARFLEQIRRHSSRPACPDVVLAELLIGCRGRLEIRKVISFVGGLLAVEYHDAADARASIELLTRYRPSHGIGYHDCLVAAMAMARGAVLHSPNVKHLGAVEGLDVRRPY